MEYNDNTDEDDVAKLYKKIIKFYSRRCFFLSNSNEEYNKKKINKTYIYLAKSCNIFVIIEHIQRFKVFYFEILIYRAKRYQ